jgi:ABC-2 type transport system permease protein
MEDRLKTLAYYLKIYLLIIRQYIKVRMEYRFDFIVSSIGMVFLNGVAVLSVWVLFGSIPELAGWKLNELLFIYGFTLLSLSPSQLFFDNLWHLRMHLREGTFIKYYFKPLNMLFYYISEVFDLKGISQVVLGIILLVASTNDIGIAWDLPRAILFVFMSLSASFIYTSLLIIAASMGFWVINSFAVMDLLGKVRDYARYPLNIFNNAFRFLFTYIIPMGFIAYYPAQFFLRTAEPPLLAYFTPLAAVLLFLAAYFIWSKGVNRYSGTGS